jgi:hypothetical protein
MPYCANCGCEQYARANFCANCGERLIRAPGEDDCPRCKGKGKCSAFDNIGSGFEKTLATFFSLGGAAFLDMKTETCGLCDGTGKASE